MDCIINKEGVTPELEDFASAVGIQNLSEIDASLRTGGDRHGYMALSQFQQNVPLESMRDASKYTGSFPSGSFAEGNAWWEAACISEVEDEVLEAWPASISKPRWFESGDRIQQFDRFLGQGDLQGAWFALNSPSWSVADAKGAIDRLAVAAKDPLFSLLATAWTAAAGDDDYGY